MRKTTAKIILPMGRATTGSTFGTFRKASASIFQFKTIDMEQEANSAETCLTPGHVSDLRRILELLRNLDNIPPTANASTTKFLQSLRSSVARFSNDPKTARTRFPIQVTLASNARKMTPQVDSELRGIESDCEQAFEGGAFQVTVSTLLQEDIIEERWREQNSDWRDKKGNKRDHVEIGVDGSLGLGPINRIHNAVGM